MIMQQYEKRYSELLVKCMQIGKFIEGRNGMTKQLFGQVFSINGAEGLPILWGRKIFSKNFLHELRWILNGDTNIKYLQENGVTIWDKWANEDGELGPTYGKQFREFGDGGVMQLEILLEELQTDLYGRRHIITLWEPWEVRQSALPPCYHSFQFLIDDRVNLLVTQRSCDLFVGLPYDMCLFYCFAQLVCAEINKIHNKELTVGDITIAIGSAHLYQEHLQSIGKYFEQLASLEYTKRVIVDGLENGIERFRPDGCELIGGYSPRHHIKTEVIK